MLNSPERLAAIVERSEIIVSVAECSADVEHTCNRLLKRQKKDKEEADKKIRKKKEEILPALTANVLKYKKNIAKEVDQDTLMEEMNEEFKKTFLVDILVYYYGMKKGDASSQ